MWSTFLIGSSNSCPQFSYKMNTLKHRLWSLPLKFPCFEGLKIFPKRPYPNCTLLFMKRDHAPFFCPFLCDDVAFLPTVLIHITLPISPLNPFLSGLWNFHFTFFFFFLIICVCVCYLSSLTKIHWFSLLFNLHPLPKFQPPKTFLFLLSSLFFALQTILALFVAGASMAF